MKILKSIYLLAVILLGALRFAGAEQLRTDINPALVYYRALLMDAEPVSDADNEYLASKKGREQKLPERFGKIVAGSDAQFGLVRQAAQCKVPCDWGIDLAPGPNIYLPHLGRARALCRMAQLRAVWALQHGWPNEARDDLLAAFVLGRNLATDGLLIGAFVQYAIEGLGYETIAQHYGEFPRDVLKQLIDGFDAAPTRRTTASCMPSEKMIGDWVLRQILELRKSHPSDDAKVMAGFRQCGIVTVMETFGETNWWSQLVEASGGTSDGVIKLLDAVDPIFPRVAEIMALPEGEFQIQAAKLSAEIQKSGNPFLAGFRRIFDGKRFPFRPREFKAQAGLELVRAAVEYKLRGETGLRTVKDPFGNGPFQFRRFIFKGVDRGFELKSAYAGSEAPFVMIFVEKQGPAFEVTGAEAGKAVAK